MDRFEDMGIGSPEWIVVKNQDKKEKGLKRKTVQDRISLLLLILPRDAVPHTISAGCIK